MTIYNTIGSCHKTLTASTVDTVDLTVDSSITGEGEVINGTFDTFYHKVEVLNRDATNTIYFTKNGTNPTIGGDGTYVLPPGTSLVVSLAPPNPFISLISSGTAAYSVTGVE